MTTISLEQNLLYALIPALAIFVGTAIGFFTPLRPKLISSLQHFVAGILIAAVAIDLIPKILQQNKVTSITIGFIIGAIFMLLIQKLSLHLEKKKRRSKIPLGITIAVLIDLAIDGSLLSISFLGGTISGLLIAIALACESLLLSLTITSSLLEKKIRRRRVAFLSLFFAAALPFGALIGTLIIQGLPTYLLTETLAFGIAALLYLAAEELLVEAHMKKDSPLTSSLFFLGFLFILVFKLTM